MISRSKNDFKLFAVMMAIMVFFYNIPQAMALEVDTHRVINEFIAQDTFNGFSLDEYLKKQLGMHDGIKTDVQNQKIFLWLGDGGETEDKPGWCIPYWRSRNHFHNPIDNSGFSGVWDTGIFSGISAIEWVLKPAGSQSCGHYSWNDARAYYFNALTSPDEATRETNYAKTFRALGQVMHLVQDMSVPEHTRNNGHYFGYDYEKWVDEPINRAAISSYNPASLKFFTPNALYPLSIINLFDTERYNGTNPDDTLQGAIGLSEYTNANFLSPDTIFTNFAYPAYTDMSEQIDNKTLYLVKNGDEGTEKYLARAHNFYKYLPPDYKKLALTTNDNKVHSNYANNLIPRAIGYSSQALSYFFRGEFEVDAVPVIIDDNIWGIASFITNMTQTNETLVNGGLFSLMYDPEIGSAVSCAATLQSDLAYNENTRVPLWFDQPINISDLESFRNAVCTVAFQGGLGTEAGAVIGKVFKLETALNFNEDWYSLEGNYPWDHTTADDNPDNGATINEVLNGVLIKDNIRFADADDQEEKARYNSTRLNLMDAGNPNGIPITASTYIEYKIDDMSIVNKPEAPPGYTSDYQVVWLHFNNGLIIELSYDAGISASAKTAYWSFFPGYIMIDNIYEMFQAYNIAIPEPLYLESISFSQQLLPSPDSPLDTSQHMEVDYFRIIDGKTG